jgi:hypothetical protein
MVLEGVTVPNKTHLPEKKGFGQTGSIGAIHYLCEQWNVELIVQDPGTRKVITNDMLKKIEWYFPSPDHHMIDAAKHMAVAMLKAKLLRIEDML